MSDGASLGGEAEKAFYVHPGRRNLALKVGKRKEDNECVYLMSKCHDFMLLLQKCLERFYRFIFGDLIIE